MAHGKPVNGEYTICRKKQDRGKMLFTVIPIPDFSSLVYFYDKGNIP